MTIMSTVARRLMEQSGIEPPRRRRPDEVFRDYRFEPERFIREILGWNPWAGTDEEPGQRELLTAYQNILLSAHDKRDYERGLKTEAELTHWKPGDQSKRVIRVEAGHTVGKTKIASGIVNHYFSCYRSIIYTFAPTAMQIERLLWKEIKVDRSRATTPLPGRTLSLRLDAAADHFAIGTATSNQHGTGTERVQGQHHDYLMFVLDEAEGIERYVYEALESMLGGGIAIVLMLANPRTRVSEFYKARKRADVINFRISCLAHPNVKTGRELVPAAVSRDYVVNMLNRHASIVAQHNPDDFTFELPWDAPPTREGIPRPAGTIFLPNNEFMFRVLGVPPNLTADTTLIPLGRYEAALQRKPSITEANTRSVYVGVDVARYGSDYGTVYVRHKGRISRAASLYHKDTHAYTAAITAALEEAHAAGATEASIRVDGTGGFGSGIIDNLKDAPTLTRLYGKHLHVHEVHFGSRARDGSKYADITTEMYAEAAETLLATSVTPPGPELQVDLTEREYVYVNSRGESVKRLEPKDNFKADPNRGAGRSPDDGDGFVLAAAPEHLFRRPTPRRRTSRSQSVFSG